MFGVHHFWLFALSVLLINITPGATFVAVSANAASKGLRAGVLTAAGACCGLIVYAALSMLGLTTIISQSVFLFNAVRYAGVAYLFYCAVKSFMQPPFLIGQASTGTHANNFRQGLLVNLLNPFSAVLFLTLIPQFAEANASNHSLQLLFLGGWICFSAFTVNLLWAFLFSFAGKYFADRKMFWQWQGKITGLLFLYLAVRFAFFK